MTPRRSLLIALLVLASCARTSGTVEIPRDELPFPVAREPTQEASAGPARTFTVYFAREARLVPASRRVGTDLAAAEAAVRALLEGPTRRERSAGMTTHLPPSVSLLGIAIRGGVADVDLSGEFQEPGPPERIAMRVAQVTWTLTALPGVGSVAFAIDGERVSVATADATTVDRPVTRDDYAAFGPVG